MIFQTITAYFIDSFSVKVKTQFIKLMYKNDVTSLKKRYASHFFTLFVCKETFNKFLTKISHTFNFHLQQIIYTAWVMFFSV
ncbi:hypothetical protein DM684_09470 [Salmonella bongori]|nr:hypothetical protein [Salmonella bongori]ECE6546458.1 hypothetical protein [Salmonella bongori]ECI3518309.1 hypothetical protein [Salmonella bongori]